MPLILNEKSTDLWLDCNIDKDKINSLIQPSTEELVTHTIRPLRGKHSQGNTPKISEKFLYDELNELF